MLNIAKIRSTTPGCEHHIHFNNAGASLPDQSVINAVTSYMNEEAILGGYELMEKHAVALESVYHSIAKMIGAQRNEIALFQSATAAWAAAFNAIDFSEGDEVLCSEVEYGSNYLNFLAKQQREGIVIRIVPSDEDGCLDIEKLEGMMNPKVKLIAITHVPTNGGLINPAAEIGAIAKKYNSLYLLDACQSIGQIPLDVENIDQLFLIYIPPIGFQIVNLSWKMVPEDLNYLKIINPYNWGWVQQLIIIYPWGKLPVGSESSFWQLD